MVYGILGKAHSQSEQTILSIGEIGHRRVIAEASPALIQSVFVELWVEHPFAEPKNEFKARWLAF